jgi:hypothetical protein
MDINRDCKSFSNDIKDIAQSIHTAMKLNRTGNRLICNDCRTG